jgi:hypothetical protein
MIGFFFDRPLEHYSMICSDWNTYRKGKQRKHSEEKIEENDNVFFDNKIVQAFTYF